MATNEQNNGSSSNCDFQNVTQSLSDLVQAYINAGTQIVSGTTRVVADTMEDLSQTYCGEVGTPEGKESTDHISNASGVCSRTLERTTEQARAVLEPITGACADKDEADKPQDTGKNAAKSVAKSAAKSVGKDS